MKHARIPRLFSPSSHGMGSSGPRSSSTAAASNHLHPTAHIRHPSPYLRRQPRLHDAPKPFSWPYATSPGHGPPPLAVHRSCPVPVLRAEVQQLPMHPISLNPFNLFYPSNYRRESRSSQSFKAKSRKLKDQISDTGQTQILLAQGKVWIHRY